jgi:hypothetical protein
MRLHVLEQRIETRGGGLEIQHQRLVGEEAARRSLAVFQVGRDRFRLSEIFVVIDSFCICLPALTAVSVVSMSRMPR